MAHFPLKLQYTFSSVQFGGGDIAFTEARFKTGNVDFSKTVFEGNVYFNGASFGAGDVIFNDVQCGNGIFNFEAITGKDTQMYFQNLIIKSHFSFSPYALKLLAFEKCTNHNVIEIAEAKKESNEGSTECPIKELVFNDVCNLGTIRFDWDVYKKALMGYNGNGKAEAKKNGTGNGSDSGSASKTVAEAGTNPEEGAKTAEGTQPEAGVKPVEKSQPAGEANPEEEAQAKKQAEERARELAAIKIGEFKMLKENFHNQGEYDWEDEAYVAFKELYTEQLEGCPLRKVLLRVLSWFGKFGTDYLSIAGAMLGVIIVCGWLYKLPWADIYPILSDGNAVASHRWSPYYYSVITFFTVGYGDLSAQNGFTALVCAIESFLGVFLMSYFSVAVVRKILR